MTGKLFDDSLNLLRKLISIPSLSREEENTASAIEQFLEDQGIKTHRMINNVWAYNEHFDPKKPTILLNSHHDTVKPNPGYSRDPFAADIIDGKLFGLGSNDAGGCLVSLIAVFIHFYKEKNL